MLVDAEVIADEAAPDYDSRAAYEGYLRSELKDLVDEDTWTKAVHTARSRTGGKAPRKSKETSVLASDKPAAVVAHDEYGCMPDYRSKMTQRDSRVDYREAFPLPLPETLTAGGFTTVEQPAGPACHACRHYQWGSCSIVEGTIEANYVCDLFSTPARVSIYASEDGKATAGVAFSLHDLIEQGGSCALFSEQKFSEAPDWIQYMPAPGEFNHPTYGNLVITRERNERIVDNFASGIYQEKLPIDVEHDLELSGAVAWIDQLKMNDDGSVEAHVSWNKYGTELIADDRFAYFSPSVMPSWPHTVTGERIADVAIGGALTTRPYFKEKWLRPIVASEQGLAAYPMPAQTGQGVFAMSEKQENPTAPAAPAVAATPAAPAVAAAPVTPAAPAAITLSDSEAQMFREFAAMGGAAGVKRIQEQAEANEKRLAEMESSNRRARFSDIVRGRGGASDGAPWVGDQQEAITLLESMAEKFGEDSEQFKALVKRETEAAVRLRTSDAFREKGNPAVPAAGSAGEAFNTAVAQKMSESGGKLDLHDARSLVAQESPELYEDYRASQRGIPTVD